MYTNMEILGMVAFAVVLVVFGIGFQIFDHVSTKARAEAKAEAERLKRG